MKVLHYAFLNSDRSSHERVLIMLAEGRDFNNFKLVSRDNPDLRSLLSKNIFEEAVYK
jgi:predicted GTPase